MDDLMQTQAPVGDANLMGFTDAAPPVDPMSFVGGGDAQPMPAMPAPQAADPFSGMPVQEAAPVAAANSGRIPEMNALREWEDKHEAKLEEIARTEAAKKEERRKAAADALKKYHEDTDGETKKRQSTNRSNEATAEKLRADSQKTGANPWERVVDLIDTNAKTADEAGDTSRMRSLLIHLKSNPVACA
eukprot:TRINITY_DN67984_c0_g1_i1.p1 TRINITY_DN67984_c0_g1~~TRINITY_DN67984_c0_g1_i1.p1  ORF type:complete len:189 (-),score=81.02 TRINITY_DN67984_c0_g1_i1:131-697(-)